MQELGLARVAHIAGGMNAWKAAGGVIEGAPMVAKTVENENRLYHLLSPKPGDLGYVIHRQAVLYAKEFGWNSEYEALIADIVAKFINNFDPKYENCWLAEINDQIVGSVFLVKVSDEIAKLRMLYVEPSVRGMGLGAGLVDTCIAFARQKGYKKLTLWTNDVLIAARRIYEKAGFALVMSENHHSFGKDLVGQYWELDL
jgi:GNAT superfamily N-acetyltransferase